mmetsp:Transcript_56046/g.119187  ORF Transcript_56046/g.119187 Transcript_56046/m.119187 type:complete len:266 (+) Transcript_56046:539-1336(+)
MRSAGRPGSSSSEPTLFSFLLFLAAAEDFSLLPVAAGLFTAASSSRTSSSSRFLFFFGDLTLLSTAASSARSSSFASFLRRRFCRSDPSSRASSLLSTVSSSSWRRFRLVLTGISRDSSSSKSPLPGRGFSSSSCVCWNVSIVSPSAATADVSAADIFAPSSSLPPSASVVSSHPSIFSTTSFLVSISSSPSPLLFVIALAMFFALVNRTTPSACCFSQSENCLHFLDELPTTTNANLSSRARRACVLHHASNSTREEEGASSWT